MVAHPAIGARPRLVSAPVATPSQTAAHDLRIEICPRGYDWWHGTGAQLQAEGLIPADFDWPKGKEHGSWVSGRFEFWLFRVRPEGHKGPKSSWLESDSWACRRVLATQARDGFMAADLYEKQQALTQEQWTHTLQAYEQRERYWTASEDQAFQAFKSSLIAARKKPARTLKAAQPATAQGNCHV